MLREPGSNDRQQEAPKSTATVPEELAEERFSFTIGEDNLETFKKGEWPTNITLPTAQNGLTENFELRPHIAHR